MHKDFLAAYIEVCMCFAGAGLSADCRNKAFDSGICPAVAEDSMCVEYIRSAVYTGQDCIAACYMNSAAAAAVCTCLDNWLPFPVLRITCMVCWCRSAVRAISRLRGAFRGVLIPNPPSAPNPAETPLRHHRQPRNLYDSIQIWEHTSIIISISCFCGI